RLMSVGHGGQVLLSQATCELIRDGPPEGTSLRDLGEHRLKDLARPEHVFQLISSDLPSAFPPLRSLHLLPHNLPRQLTSCAACAILVDALLRACARLRILAASREAPGIAGETTWRVPSLVMPDVQQLSFGAADLALVLSHYEAVRMFIDRAVAVAPAVAVTN